MRRYLGIAFCLGLILLPTLLLSQGLPKWSGQLMGIADYTGSQFSTANPFPVKAVGATPGSPGQVQLTPLVGTPIEVAVSCPSTAGANLLLAAGAATQFVRVKIPRTAGVTVWFDYSGAAAVAAAPSDDMVPGESIVWSAGNGFLPTSQINCIATSGTVSVTVIYK